MNGKFNEPDLQFDRKNLNDIVIQIYDIVSYKQVLILTKCAC
jgi:hypothetical protein